ncbi:hypothetical protein GCM10010103_79200 [Streptomyces paradoxus]
MDGGLEADGELVEPGGHCPVALESVDAALDRVPGVVVVAVEGRRAPVVVVAVEGRRAPAVAAAASAVAGLVGRFRDGGRIPRRRK